MFEGCRDISVVIPMYNSSNTILNAIESIENQTMYDSIKEIIIINDGSKDNSRKLVEEVAKKNKKIKLITQENQGAAVARNHGIRLANNNWIALLDADDLWVREKIEKQIEIINKYPEILALGTNKIGDDVVTGTKVNNGLYSINVFQYCIRTWPFPSSLLFRKDVFKNDIYFDERLSHAEEGPFYIFLASLNGLYYLTDPLIDYGGGKMGFGESGLSGNIKGMHKGVMSMMKSAKEKKYLTIIEYIVVFVFEYIKYLRRIIIVKMKK